VLVILNMASTAIRGALGNRLGHVKGELILSTKASRCPEPVDLDDIRLSGDEGIMVALPGTAAPPATRPR
jgi:hypothetical protein